MTIKWKTIGIALAAVLGVLVLAIGLFIVFFPKDLAAREAERRIEETTGRDLVLGGEIGVSFWPALGFTAEQASLSNPEGFPTDEPFIAADRIVFAVALLPLIGGKVEVKELIFEGAELRLLADGEGAANWTFPTETEDQERPTIEDLRLDDVRLVDGMISFVGGKDEPPLVLDDVDASLALDSLDTPGQLEAAFNYRNERLSVQSQISTPRAVLEQGETPLSATVESGPISASFAGAFNVATGALSGRLQANGASLRRVLAWIGSPMAEGGGFAAFSLEAQMAHAGERTDFTQATIRLDDIEARGNLGLVTQENERLRVNGALSAGTIDLNPYLPAPAQGGEAGGVEVDTQWSAAPLDLTGLRALDADLNLTLAGLRFQRMNFANVALGLRIANGAADARLTRISLYDGAGTARLIADGSGATPRVAVELSVDNIQAEPLLRDAIGFDNIVGRGRLNASLVGAGGSQAAIMRSLRGNAGFSFNDGQWKGVNLAAVARTVQAAMSGQTPGASGSTDFAELAATLTVADGVAATDNLRMLNPFVRLEGRGVINIGAQTIDMRLAPRAVRSIEGQGGDTAAQGVGVPFRITGPWSNVSFRPALEDVVQEQLRNVLSQRQNNGGGLGALGDALFGTRPQNSQAPAQGEQPATPAEQPQQQQRNPLADMFRRATEGDRQKQADPTP